MKQRAVKLRPSVERFAQLMERKLREHDRKKGKRGWIRASPNYLLHLLSLEYAELLVEWGKVSHQSDSVLAETVDLANMCMMVHERGSGED